MRDKLLHNIMKPTDPFKAAIQKHLDEVAEKDSLFAETMKKPNKNIDDCINYIINEVQKSGRQGFTDDEVYGMAIHYYDEDDINPGKKSKAKVIVNHSVELTPKEIEDAKQKAIDQAIQEAKEKMQKKISSGKTKILRFIIQKRKYCNSTTKNCSGVFGRRRRIKALFIYK